MKTYFHFALKSWRFLSPITRRKFIYLSPLLVIGAIGELIAVLSLGALTAVAFRITTNESRPTRIEILFDQYFPLQLNSQQIMLLLTLGAISLLAAKTSFMMFINFKVANFLAEEESTISSRIFSNLLNSSIDDDAGKSIGEYQYLILNATSRLMNSVILPLLNLMSDIFTTFFLVTTAILVSPSTGIGILLLLLIIYFTLNKVLGRKTHAYGELIGIENIKLTDLIAATIRGKKEIKVYQVSKFLNSSFSESRFLLARVVQRSNLLNGIFRFVADLVILFLGVFILSIQILTESDLRRNVSILVLYLAIGYRLLPAIQRLQGTLTSLRLSRPALEPLLEIGHFDETTINECFLMEDREKTSEPVAIKARNISFEYKATDTESRLISDLNFYLKPGKLLVLWGSSGSGKTTLLDLLAGLRPPSSGTIDFENAHGQIVSNVSKSYVGQEPFLKKGKLFESLNLGLEFDDEYIVRINDLMDLLNLSGDLRKFEDFELSENSKNVSGGEKQRISIARAFAIPSSIVFMDEPTSALDSNNHDSVLRMIKSQLGSRTMIIASHDLQIREIADEVIFLGGNP